MLLLSQQPTNQYLINSKCCPAIHIFPGILILYISKCEYTHDVAHLEMAIQIFLTHHELLTPLLKEC